jgi:replicative DNA helicase
MEEILKTGFRKLDSVDFGLKRGEVAFIYARLGIGKSSFLSNLFVNMISQVPNMRCLYFVFEEPEKFVFEKMVSLKSGAPFGEYLSGEIYNKKREVKIGQAEEWLGEKVHSKKAVSRIIDKAHSLAEIFLYVSESVAKQGVDAVLIDGLRYLKEYADEDYYYTVELLKELATRLNIAIVVTDCLPRSKNFYPLRKQIKNKAVLRLADKIIILHRPEMFATAEQLENGEVVRGKSELYIVKNYGGCCGVVDLRFESATLRFYEPERNIEEDW